VARPPRWPRATSTARSPTTRDHERDQRRSTRHRQGHRAVEAGGHSHAVGRVAATPPCPGSSGTPTATSSAPWSCVPVRPGRRGDPDAPVAQAALAILGCGPPRARRDHRRGGAGADFAPCGPWPPRASSGHMFAARAQHRHDRRRHRRELPAVRGPDDRRPAASAPTTPQRRLAEPPPPPPNRPQPPPAAPPPRNPGPADVATHARSPCRPPRLRGTRHRTTPRPGQTHNAALLPDAGAGAAALPLPGSSGTTRSHLRQLTLSIALCVAVGLPRSWCRGRCCPGCSPSPRWPGATRCSSGLSGACSGAAVCARLCPPKRALTEDAEIDRAAALAELSASAVPARSSPHSPGHSGRAAGPRPRPGPGGPVVIVNGLVWAVGMGLLGRWCSPRSGWLRHRRDRDPWPRSPCWWCCWAPHRPGVDVLHRRRGVQAHDPCHPHHAARYPRGTPPRSRCWTTRPRLRRLGAPHIGCARPLAGGLRRR